MDTKKVLSAIGRLRKQKNVQEKVINKIEAAVNRGAYRVSFSQISDVMVQKLENQKFGVEVIPKRERELPEMIKCIVDWYEFPIKLKK